MPPQLSLRVDSDAFSSALKQIFNLVEGPIRSVSCTTVRTENWRFFCDHFKIRCDFMQCLLAHLNYFDSHSRRLSLTLLEY